MALKALVGTASRYESPARSLSLYRLNSIEPEVYWRARWGGFVICCARIVLLKLFPALSALLNRPMSTLNSEKCACCGFRRIVTKDSRPRPSVVLPPPGCVPASLRGGREWFASRRRSGRRYGKRRLGRCLPAFGLVGAVLGRRDAKKLCSSFSKIHPNACAIRRTLGSPTLATVRTCRAVRPTRNSAARN